MLTLFRVWRFAVQASRSDAREKRHAVPCKLSQTPYPGAEWNSLHLGSSSTTNAAAHCET